MKRVIQNSNNDQHKNQAHKITIHSQLYQHDNVHHNSNTQQNTQNNPQTITESHIAKLRKLQSCFDQQHHSRKDTISSYHPQEIDKPAFESERKFKSKPGINLHTNYRTPNQLIAESTVSQSIFSPTEQSIILQSLKVEGLGQKESTMMMKEQAQMMRVYFESQMERVIGDQNDQISHLSNLLLDNQRELQAKTLLIQQLQSSITQIKFETDELQRKVESLQNTLKGLQQKLDFGTQQVDICLQKIQVQLIKYHSMRVGKCYKALEKYQNQINTRLGSIEASFLRNNQPNSNFCYIQNQMAIVRQEVDNLRHQFLRQNHYLVEIKQSLEHTHQKIRECQLQKQSPVKTKTINSRKSMTQFLEEDDEFFYPPSNRVSNSIKDLQKDSDYEHFHSEQSDQPDYPSRSRYLEFSHSSQMKQNENSHRSDIRVWEMSSTMENKINQILELKSPLGQQNRTQALRVSDLEEKEKAYVLGVERKEQQGRKIEGKVSYV